MSAVAAACRGDKNKMNQIATRDRGRGHPAYDISGLNILILEKQSLMQSLMKQVFRTFRVSKLNITDDPHEAYQSLLHAPADIILCDWSHDLDGLEFLRLVRNDDNSPNPFVPVVMVTAHSERHHVMKARDAGMTEFLAKPVSANTIYGRLCAVIDSTRAFVRTHSFFGPDRRRRSVPFDGGDRRGFVAT